MEARTEQLSERIEALIARTRQRLRRNAIITGVALLVLASTIWLALAVTADLLFALPVPLRVAAFAGLWVVVATVGAVAVLWPALRPMSLERVAFRIERVLGNMHNRLVTVLDLRTGRRELTGDAAPLAARLIDQTTEKLEGYDVKRIASPQPAIVSSAAAAALVVLAVLLGVLFAEYSGNALARIMQPTQPIPPVAWVRLAADPGDARVLQGDSLQLRGVVTRGEVERLTLRLSPAAGRAVRYPMQRDSEGRFSFTLSSLEADHRYQIEGGGTWTPPHTIDVVRRPILEAIHGQVHLPDYMRLPEPQPVSRPTEQISAPIASYVRLAATVRGDVARGHIHLYDAVTETVARTDERETVWLDDDTPGDAEHIGQWRWTESNVHSGGRAHGFDWSREPYGFRTRLSPLTVEPEASLFIWTWLDPQATPGQIDVDVFVGDKTHRLTWAPAERLEQVTADDKPRHAGELPEAGQWVRLEVTAEALAGRADRAVELTGMRLAIDGGRATFDRVGAIARRTREVEQQTLVRRDSLPMRRDEATGQWRGQVRVEDDVLYAVELENDAGHASAAMQPVPIVATRDRAPTLIVERPGRNLTVASDDAMPLVVRVFDDHGLDAVLLQVSASPDDFNDGPRAVARFDEPRASRLVTSALDPASYGLTVEQPLHYRVIVRDTKGQETASEPFRLAMVDESDEAYAEAERRTPLDGLLDGLGRLLEAQAELAGGALEMLARLPEGLTSRLGEDGELELVDADGNVLSEEETAAALARWQEEGFSEQQQEAWDELGERLAAQQAQLHQMAQQLQDAAQLAGESAHALPGEQAALQAMADRAAAMADDAEAMEGEELDAEVLERLARLNEMSDDERAQYEQLQSELRQLVNAQQQLAGDPDAARQSLANLMMQMQARQRMQQMNQLDQHMAAEQAGLDELREQVEALRQQAAEADGEELGAISEQQQELDPEALEAMRRTAELLAQRRQQQAEDEIALPPPPWDPPMATREAMPTEHDTADDAETDDAADAAQLAEADEAADGDWWDQPVDAPLTPEAQAELAERYQDREQRPIPVDEAEAGAAGGEDEPPQPTPREMLDAHQRQLAEALRAQGEQLGEARGDLAQTQAGMEQAVAGMDAEAMQAMMQSPGMQQAMAMSGAAAMQQAMAAAQASQSGLGQDAGQPAMSGQATPDGAGDGDGDPPPGGVVFGMTLAPADMDGLGPAVYRLPPSVRQPLVQGMRERGPEAYQRLIDSYYRELSERMGDE